MRKILVVDDEPLDRELAGRCLEGVEGLKVLFAADGIEAIEVVESDPPDVVLTDLRMPRLDGLELVSRIADEHPLIPVVLMTSHGGESAAVRALKAGASSYVPKRDLGVSLADTVAQVLQIAEARRSRVAALRQLERQETRFSLTNDLDLIAPVASFMQEGLSALGFGTEAVRTQVGMAILEALSNAIIHGNLEISSELKRSDRERFERTIEERCASEPYASRTVTFVATATPTSAIYVVEDGGRGFDPGELPDPTAPENLMQVSGRGLFLIRTFMDRVSFNDSGTAITMEKKDPRHAG